MNKASFFSYPGATRIILSALLSLFPPALNAADSPPARTAIVRAVDLDVNEAQEIELATGTKARVKLRWFASHTQMANEPSFVDGGEAPGNKKIYYHYGLDSGGAEGMADVVAAAAGRVISSGKEILPGHDDSPVKPRYDVVYLLDDRGWFYRYSHLQIIDPADRKSVV